MTHVYPHPTIDSLTLKGPLIKFTLKSIVKLLIVYLTQIPTLAQQLHILSTVFFRALFKFTLKSILKLLIVYLTQIPTLAQQLHILSTVFFRAAHLINHYHSIALAARLGGILEDGALFRSLVNRGHPGVLLVGSSLPPVWCRDPRASPTGCILSSAYSQESSAFSDTWYPRFGYDNILYNMTGISKNIHFSKRSSYKRSFFRNIIKSTHFREISNHVCPRLIKTVPDFELSRFRFPPSSFPFLLPESKRPPTPPTQIING